MFEETLGKRISRKDLLIGGGGAILGGLALKIFGSGNEVAPTQEQIEKQEAIRDLAKFMEDYTTDTTVSDFLSRASFDDINNSVKLGTVNTYYGKQLKAWQLTIPSSSDSGDENVTISYYTSKLNGSGDYWRNSEGIRTYIDREGKIRVGLKKDDPSLTFENYDAEGYDPFTEDEMKQALKRFERNNNFLSDEGWNTHYTNDAGKATELTISTRGQDNRNYSGSIRENGFVDLEVRIPEVAPSRDVRYY